MSVTGVDAVHLQQKRNSLLAQQNSCSPLPSFFILCYLDVLKSGGGEEAGRKEMRFLKNGEGYESSFNCHHSEDWTERNGALRNVCKTEIVFATHSKQSIAGKVLLHDLRLSIEGIFSEETSIEAIFSNHCSRRVVCFLAYLYRRLDYLTCRFLLRQRSFYEVVFSRRSSYQECRSVHHRAVMRTHKEERQPMNQSGKNVSLHSSLWGYAQSMGRYAYKSTVSFIDLEQ